MLLFKHHHHKHLIFDLCRAMIFTAQPPSNPTQPVPVPEGWPRLPVLANLVGGMGSGKTHLCAQLIRAYLDRGSINRVFLVSPTYFTNNHLWTYCGVDPEDCFTEIGQAPQAVEEIVRRIRADHKAYVQQREYKEAHMAWRGGRPLTMKQRSLLENCEFRAPQADVALIRPVIVLDDLQASPLMSQRSFHSLILRMRHICHSPQVGTSFIILSQSLKNGALPRSLRSCVGLWCIFPTRDRTVAKDLWAELSGRITWREFQNLLEHSTTGEGRPYLVADMTQGGNPKTTFKRSLQGSWLDPSDFD